MITDKTEFASLQYIVNHLFLPPKLPQENDWTSFSHTELLKLVQTTIDGFILLMQAPSQTMDDKIVRVWTILHRMVDKMLSTRGPQAGLDADILARAVLDMAHDDTLCFHVVSQNAGVILRKVSDEEITFEVFQASPPAANVTSTIGKLITTFPSMPRLAFPSEKRCVLSFCRIISWLDRTKMTSAIAKSGKAGTNVSEEREVTDIHYLSQMLGSILATATTSDVGETAKSTIYVTKRIGDNVLWAKADLPWRRMPEWLILRVALQTTLKVLGVDAESQFGYKSFITYLLATILKKACLSKIDHELLHVMNVKIAARIWKLRASVKDGPVFDFISEQVKECRSILQGRWDQILEMERSPLSFKMPSRDDILYASQFWFPKSKNYLSRIYNRPLTLDTEVSFDIISFETGLSPKLSRSTGNSPPQPFNEKLGSHEFWLAVIDFESWIGDQMPNWKRATEPSTQIDVLHASLSKVIQFSNEVTNPELFSRLYLIILELWVALDEAAIRICVLLSEFSPEIPIESFEPLLLPQASQMKRLHHVEEYISRRWAQVQRSASIFSFDASKNSFPYQYYSTDFRLPKLREEIRKEANADMAAKKRQWEKLQKQHAALISQSSRLDHLMMTNRRGYLYHADRRCEKCQLEQEASSMKIEVFEWPLPEDATLERMVVFELRPPHWFTVWRDITHNIAKIKQPTERGSDETSVILRDYNPLQKYAINNSAITIASGSKPWYKSHYSSVSVANASLSEIIRPHPLQHRLFDSKRQKWVESFPVISLRDNCTPSLNSNVYSSLSYAIRSTTHTSNMVIARQSDCHQSLSVHEWGSFGHLRAGGRLQWRNILIELLKGVGSFKDPSWFVLLRQAVWQVERLGEGLNEYRDFHRDLLDNSFALEALGVLQDYYNSVCENWQEGWTVMSLAMLTCRIHSLNTNASVRTDALSLLTLIRRTCRSWMEDVQKCYLDPTSDTDLKANLKDDLLFRLIHQEKKRLLKLAMWS